MLLRICQVKNLKYIFTSGSKNSLKITQNALRQSWFGLPTVTLAKCGVLMSSVS